MNPLAAWVWQMVQDGELFLDPHKVQGLLFAARREEQTFRAICEYTAENDCWPGTKEHAADCVAWMAARKWIAQDFAVEMLTILGG